MEKIILLDTRLFLFINHLPHGIILDTAAFIVSGIGLSRVLWLAIGIFLFIREEFKDRFFYFYIIIIGFVMWFGQYFIKPFFGRPRPSSLINAIVMQENLADYSFPSGHAFLAFAVAVILSSKEPNSRFLFYFLASLAALSRVYLGVHYPSDIVIGSLLGFTIGRISILLKNRV